LNQRLPHERDSTTLSEVFASGANAKSADQTIGIDKLAQAVTAILPERPHDARARPTSVMREETLYQKLFSDLHSPGNDYSQPSFLIAYSPDRPVAIR
jgi:hypothetical protein